MSSKSISSLRLLCGLFLELFPEPYLGGLLRELYLGGLLRELYLGGVGCSVNCILVVNCFSVRGAGVAICFLFVVVNCFSVGGAGVAACFLSMVFSL